ncbi:aldehyde dehydrogenase family protein [Phreatobacter sp. AB_2022a]|uniref:aldehyde dehydrogenase family protein n=1 Tax=Phreatobacter sp. AB_2022a TaxID=3003134 RepID=UPI002286F040|nr:aldehyde dehydrogenase family protein [Phreatobacter sp. AB_2022a]MCZ0733376.1 aldehyde dehydrogenase family protein [Phreatobacter sp. AB_2022a]
MRTQLFIDGGFVDAHAGRTLASIDPATEAVLGMAAAGDKADIDRAVAAAVRAFAGDWRRTTGAQRAVLLRRIAAAIASEREALARLEVQDNGKPLAEAQWDVDDAAACFQFYADLADELDDARSTDIALPDQRFESRARQEPIGPCGLIVPWNYPLLMAAWKVAPALAAGCTAVLKPSEVTPFSAIRLAEICAEAGLPPGVLNVVTGFGHEAGAALVAHPDIRKIAFTGSVPTGQRVMRAAAEGTRPVSLELGGKSAIIVFDDVDIDHAIAWIMFGIFWNQGQVCSATSRLIVERSIAPRLTDRLIEAASAIPIGSGLEPATRLGPLVSREQYGKVLGFIERARNGAALVAGGGRPAHLARGFFLEPTIFADVPVDHEVWIEEIFGPVLAMRTFAAESEAIQLANDSRFGLAAAVLTADTVRADRVAEALDAGIVWINCSQPTFVEAPWGGRKHSGFGRELGRWGLAGYLDVKQITRYRSAAAWDWYRS